MAVEFAPQRVRVNAIAPSATMTDRVRGQLEAGNPRVTKLAAAHLVGLIEPEDIANMAVFHEIVTPLSTGYTCPVTIRDSSKAKGFDHHSARARTAGPPCFFAGPGLRVRPERFSHSNSPLKSGKRSLPLPQRS
jgi:hypothetical protein